MRTSGLKSKSEKTKVGKLSVGSRGMRKAPRLGSKWYERMSMKRFKLDKCQGIEDTECRLDTKSSQKFYRLL